MIPALLSCGNDSPTAARPDASQVTSEWVNHHCYFVSFEHAVSLQVLHSHNNRPRLKFLGRNSKFFFGGGDFPPKYASIKHCSVGILWKCLMVVKLEWLGYRMVKNYDDMLSRFHLVPERIGRTDGRTDGQTYLLYQYRASVCWRAIKMTQNTHKKVTQNKQ